MARKKKVETDNIVLNDEIKKEDEKIELSVDDLIEVVVINAFRDKYTDEEYFKNDKIKLTKERFNEITKTNSNLIRKIGK